MRKNITEDGVLAMLKILAAIHNRETLLAVLSGKQMGMVDHTAATKVFLKLAKLQILSETTLIKASFLIHYRIGVKRK